MLSHGFPAVNFVVVNTMAKANESNNLALLRSRAAGIPVYQETPSEPVWGLLGGKNASVVVFDSCGRMAYQVIAPWSSPNHQYIKAAILSAYRDNVCGPCSGNRLRDYRMSISPEPRPIDETLDEQTSTTPPEHPSTETPSLLESEQRDQSTTPVSQNLRDHQGSDIFEPTSEEFTSDTSITAPETTDSNFTWNRNVLFNIKTDDEAACDQKTSNYGPVVETVTLSPLVEINGKIPIRVIYRDSHLHANSTEPQEYVVLQTGNPNYHGHLQIEEPANTLEEPKNITKIAFEEPISITNTSDDAKNITKIVLEEPIGATNTLDKAKTAVVNNSVRVEIVVNDLENLNLTTSRESAESVELVDATSTPEPYFSEKVEVTADDLVDANEDDSVTRGWTRQHRKKRRRKQRRKYRPSPESQEYESSVTTPSIEELVEERQRHIDSEQNMIDVKEQDDIVKLKIIESYRRLVPWLDYDL